jgi:hypothetical protein
MIKKSLLLTASVSLALVSAAQVTDPMITKWWFNKTGNRYSGILTDVEIVYYNAQNVYIKTSGIPNYYKHGVTHNDGKDLQATWNITRTPAPSGNPTGVMGGQMGLMLDGSVFFHPGDAQSYNSAGVWNRLAYYFEGVDMDAANGHSTPTNMYHHHFDNLALHDWDSSKHAPIVGYAWDGYPVYGPFAYEGTGGTGKITRIRSSYRTKSYTTRTNGPNVDMQYPIGCFIEDWEYVQGYGHLDQHNGRFTITPEYPNGTYAYFTTVDENLKPIYPYFVGPKFYGVITQGNTGPNGGKATVPAGASSYTTDVDEITKIEAGVQLYPVPVTDYLNIDIKDGKTYNVVLYGLQGNVIEQATIAGQGKINMSSLPYGTYFVEVSDKAANTGFLKRIVKQ